MIQFKKTYFGIAVVIFIIEVIIALYVHDNFVRPYLGDVLVVILIYCFLKAFIKAGVLAMAGFVLIFSFAIEFLQYINVVEMLGLQNSRIARTVIGTSFAWIDLLCYLAGIAIVLIVEYIAKNIAISRSVTK